MTAVRDHRAHQGAPPGLVQTGNELATHRGQFPFGGQHGLQPSLFLFFFLEAFLELEKQFFGGGAGITRKVGLQEIQGLL